MKTLIENTTYVGNITTKTFSSITCTFMSRNYIIVTISINFLKKLAQYFNKGLIFFYFFSKNKSVELNRGTELHHFFFVYRRLTFGKIIKTTHFLYIALQSYFNT